MYLGHTIPVQQLLLPLLTKSPDPEHLSPVSFLHLHCNVSPPANMRVLNNHDVNKLKEAFIYCLSERSS